MCITSFLYIRLVIERHDMKERFSHKLNLKKVAEGLGLSESEVIAFLNDGRIVGRLGEFIYANKIGAQRAKSEGSSYDVDGVNGERIEVRSITEKISFASSKEVGYGRKVTENGFNEKMNSLDFFVGIDFREMSNLRFIEIGKEDVKEMESAGILRKNKSVGFKKFFNFLNSKNK